MGSFPSESLFQDCAHDVYGGRSLGPEFKLPHCLVQKHLSSGDGLTTCLTSLRQQSSLKGIVDNIHHDQWRCHKMARHAAFGDVRAHANRCAMDQDLILRNTALQGVSAERKSVHGLAG